MKAQIRPGPHIVMLLENNPYPQDPRVRREAEALVGAGYRVSVICPAAPGQPRHELLNDVATYRFPAPPAANTFLGYAVEYGYSLVAMFVISLWILIRRGIDVIHAANPPDTHVIIAAFYKLLGKRFVYDHHDLASEMYFARFSPGGSRHVYRMLLILEKLSLRLADHVITTNESYKASEMERGRIPSERITVVRNGPDLTRLPPLEPSTATDQGGKTLIGYIGVLGFQDGVDYLLRALKHLIADLGRRDVACLILGDGDALDSLKALATHLGLDDYISFKGYVPYADAMRYLSRIDIGVVPDPSNSYNDRSTMIKLMEYMALAKPIVAFDLPEHRFTAQQSAQYVRPNDELAFARALADLMDNPERRREMGLAGRRRVETELAWSHCVPHLLHAYRTLLPPSPTEKPGRPGSGGLFGATGRRRLSRFADWLRHRNAPYLFARLTSLYRRYGLSSTRAKQRTIEGLTILARYDCRPTLVVPGRVVENDPGFFRELQTRGVEVAIHGYDHVDFKALTLKEATSQFVKAAEAFRQAGIQFAGFRCPYLSYSDSLQASIPHGMFQYSSNRAIRWNVTTISPEMVASPIFRNLQDFYHPDSAETALSLPTAAGPLIEIPPSVPDDLQMLDAVKLGDGGLAQTWTEVLEQSHRRGEIFVLMFHPEAFDRCAQAFARIFATIERLQPAVWVAQLRDVSAWWCEKSSFSASVSTHDDALTVHFDCSPRATILVRSLDLCGHAHAWDGGYQVLTERMLRLPDAQRPFIGVSSTVPPATVNLLKEHGYIVEDGLHASDCGIYIESITQWDTPRALIEYIEASPAPLVRFWRWPDANKSALCITGDLDALNLRDYGWRFLRW